jgi:hypothetical protein
MIACVGQSPYGYERSEISCCAVAEIKPPEIDRIPYERRKKEEGNWEEVRN